MARWKGSTGEIKVLTDVDSTGTSFYERRKKNERNLDDLIHYFEYAKDSGYPAARVDKEQEEYWACLIRHLLIEKLVTNLTYLVPVYKTSVPNKLLGISFVCNDCGTFCKMEYVNNIYKVGNQDCYEITKHCDCGLTKRREDDILEYLEHLINKHCKESNIESVKDFEEKERKRINDEEEKKYLGSLEKEEKCEKCEGSGYVFNNKEGTDTCNECNGLGVKPVHDQFCSCEECEKNKPKFGFDD